MYDDLVKRLMYCRNNAAIISAEELVEIADETADAVEELQAQLMFSNDAAKAIAEKVPKWIPVTERLPEKHKWVLVKSKFVKMKTDFISNDGHWYTTPGVTHWMPLPEPPKEE